MINTLPIKNLIRRPARTFALVIISAFLSFCVFGGSLILSSLKSGLNSLQARLGADIVAVPDEAAKNKDLEAILIQGKTGYFYMDRSNIDNIAKIEGVEAVSPQYFLATVSEGCCSMPVQVIGFEPETDFSVKPWIQKSYKNNIELDDVLVGANINTQVGDDLMFYGHNCKVAARLETTGTELDNAVYTNADTIKVLMAAAKEKGIELLAKNDPDTLISSVLIKVKEGHDPQKIAGEINVHYKNVSAVQTQSMISGIAKSLGGISEVVQILMWVVRILSLGIMIAAFAMITNERKQEFAVLRAIGATRGKLAGIILSESFITGLLGGVLGVALACLLILPFGGVIEQKTSLPYLLPNIGSAALAVLTAIATSAVAGPVAAVFSAVKISKIDTSLILRSN
ncbi:MAG: FtsX-like permease family protein [Firmicutes bacterium]|nr:FtsX-like permease family protein [Bacillota bacterium]